MLDFPENWDFGWEVIKFIDGIVDWVVVNWDPFFSAINTGVLRILLPFEDFLLWIPWWFFIILIGFVAWRAAGYKFGTIAVVFLVAMSFLGLYDLTHSTLAIVLTASLICVALGTLEKRVTGSGSIAAGSNHGGGLRAQGEAYYQNG